MTSNKNLVDLKKELLIQVAGKEEENHTLSWELLKKIGDNTQKLLDTLANSSTEEGVSSEHTKLIFVGFYPGSAVPAWRLDNEPNLLFPIKAAKILNDDFNFVLKSLDSGNFQQIADKYNEPSVKNEVVNAVYEFSNSVGTKPLAVVKRLNTTDKIKFKPLAKVRKMTIKQKNLLSVKVPEPKIITNSESIEAVGKFIISKTATGRTSKKNVQLYTQKEAVLSLRFDSIETDKRIYLLKSELTFCITHDDKKSFVIENQMLDIFAQGENLAEAELDLFEQFDFTYRRLLEIDDDKLSRHLLDAKKYITLIVDTVKDK